MDRRTLSLLLVVCSWACGAQGAQGPGPTSPLSVRERQIFDDGVDLLEDSEALQDRWKADWERDIGDRIEHSDVIAVGKITTLRTDVDPEGRTSYRLAFGVERVLAGHARGSELSLSSENGASGYSSIEQHRDHLLQRPLFVFVKYAAEADGSAAAHFHLAPPSKSVETRIAVRETQKRPHRVLVIEHQQ